MNRLMKTLPAMFTAAVLPFVSTSSDEGQVKENPKPVLVKKADDPKVAQAPKAKLPKLFQPHDFNGDKKIDVNEALEFHIDKATIHPNYELNGYGSIQKKEIEKVADWYLKVATLKGTSPEEKEVCLDIAAMLHDYMKNKDSIPTPLPRVIALFDEDNNGKISLQEALKFYEARTGTKLERKENGEVTPASFRKAIADFKAINHREENSFKITTYSASYMCRFRIVQTLSQEYERLYGPLPAATSDIIEKE